MAFYEENNSAFDEFTVMVSTPTYLPFTNSSVIADTLPRATTILTVGKYCRFEIIQILFIFIHGCPKLVVVVK